MKNILLLLIVLSVSAFSQWQFIGLSNRNVSSLTNVNGVLFAGTDNKIYKSTDDGLNWTAVTNPSQWYYTFSVESKGDTLIAWSYGDYTYYSTDLGVTWKNGAQVPNLFNYWKMHNGVLYAGSSVGLFRSNNGGMSYDQITMNAFFDVRGVAVNGNDIWSSSYNQGLWHSTNDGQNWTNVTAGLSTQNFSDLIRKGDIVVAGTRGEKGINRTTDNGQTWSVVNPTWDVSSFYMYADNIFAFKYGFGAEAGPIRSTNYGLTWEYANQGLTANVAVFYKYKNYLYAGTAVGGGVYRRNLSDWGLPSAVKSEISEIKTFALYNNYPNPFNPSTKIKFSVAESGPVSLRVFNSVGQEVAVLVNNFINAGTHEVTFEAKDIAGGVYFYRLSNATTTLTKSMILLK